MFIKMDSLGIIFCLLYMITSPCINLVLRFDKHVDETYDEDDNNKECYIHDHTALSTAVV